MRTNLDAGPPALSLLGPAMAWLRDHDIAPARIADAFGTSARHVNLLVWRARRERVRVSHAAVKTDVDLGVPSQPLRVDALTDAFEEIRVAYVSSQDFPGALSALLAFRPQLGKPASPAMVALLARWHAQRAWFAVHCGRTVTATREAAAARTLFARLYRETGDRAHLKQLADAALIGSHAHLYVNRPGESLALLKVFRDASERASNPLGSDYHRQLGTAYALEARFDSDGAAQAATRVLAQVPVVMARVGEGRSDAQLAFAGRQQHLLGSGVNVEACEGLVELASGLYGPSSLESMIALNYCAAARLSTGTDSRSHKNGLALLEEMRPEPARFPQQAAVTHLLRLTPRLRLDAALRRRWIRQVSYLNPYRRM